MTVTCKEAATIIGITIRGIDKLIRPTGSLRHAARWATNGRISLDRRAVESYARRRKRGSR